ncbi:MAG TPA: energy transducer TonB [Vicinamibacterales bacterium]|nr:energy transducer TonB [Vicinamibacterales bacterium]
MSKVGVAAFVIAMGLALPAAAQLDGPTSQGGPLNTAKDLYASARYDEALSVLNGLRIGDSADRRAVEQYRSLCLLALGRASEAESAIAAVVKEDPTYRPGESESPRVRATFAEVRKRLLPEITTTRYQIAKLAYDRRDWASAESQFRTVLALIDDPENVGRLSDLRVLAAGFLELSVRAAAPPPPVEPRPAPAVAAPPPAAPPGPDPGKIYTAEDTTVTAPIVVTQNIPGIPPSLMALARPRGLVEVVIDELGRVIGMSMRGSIHPTYDAQVLMAARDWKYKPATFNGKPVKFRRLISINVQR